MATIQQHLQLGITRLANISSSARLDAQLLMNHVLGVETAYLFTYPERELNAEQQAQYEGFVERRERGEPIAYILGSVGFYDREFYVTPAVLIPRPETEHLVEAAIEFLRSNYSHPMVAVDIGTGSGIIAITVTAHAKNVTMYAVDVSADALEVARRNAEMHQVSVQFMQGNLAEPLIEAGVKVNLLMANLPYIPTRDMLTLAVSQHEPHLALDGGDDGLALIVTLLQQLRTVCADDALILLEIGADQGLAMLSLVSSVVKPRAVRIVKDYSDRDRLVKIEL